MPLSFVVVCRLLSFTSLMTLWHLWCAYFAVRAFFRVMLFFFFFRGGDGALFAIGRAPKAEDAFLCLVHLHWRLDPYVPIMPYLVRTSMTEQTV